MNAPVITMTLDEWRAEGKRRFGPNPVDWRFVCPACGTEASGQDFEDAGAGPDAMRSECIGRHVGGSSAFEGKGPCDYAGYGLIRLSPVLVTRDDGTAAHSFAFADSGKQEDL